MTDTTVQPAPMPVADLDRPSGSGRFVCPDCGYHDGYHGEDCHLDDAELRALEGDR